MTNSSKKIKELETMGNVPVTVQEQALYTLNGVISEIPTEMTEMEIQQELQRQKVTHVNRIMRKSPNQTNSEKRDPNQTRFTPTRSHSRQIRTTMLPKIPD